MQEMRADPEWGRRTCNVLMSRASATYSFYLTTVVRKTEKSFVLGTGTGKTVLSAFEILSITWETQIVFFFSSRRRHTR